MLVHLIFSQRALRLSSFFFFFYSHSFLWILFCSSDFHHSILQVIYPFFCLSYSAIDSSLFVCSLVLLGLWQTFLASSLFFFFLRSWIIFIIIILNSFPGSLPISTSFSCFSGVLSCPFIWDITLCLFIMINLLGCGFRSGSRGLVVLVSFVCPLVEEPKRLV